MYELLLYLDHMKDKKLSQKEIEELQAEIKRYAEKSVGSHERRFKLNMPFEKAADKIVRAAKPRKQSSKK